MKPKFLWSGEGLSRPEMQEVESSIAGALQDNFSDLLSSPTTVRLKSDILKSLISGVVIDSDGKEVISITRHPYDQDRTTLKLIQGKKKPS